MASGASRPARDLLAVRIELDPPRTRVAIGGLWVLAALLKVTSWTRFVREQAFVVQVFRIADGGIVATFPHTDPAQARQQARKLRTRIDRSRVGDVCAHLGVSTAAVSPPEEPSGV